MSQRGIVYLAGLVFSLACWGLVALVLYDVLQGLTVIP